MKRITDAARSADVYLDTARTWNDVTEVTMQSLDMDRSAAAQWLLSTIRLPTRRDASVLVSTRACVPVLRAKPHLMQTLKEIVCSAFFIGIGQPRENLSPETSTLWLNNLAYLLSERGRPSLMTGMAGMLRHVGANSMEEEALNFGARPVIHTTTGHIALGSCFVRATLESKAGVRSGRRSGVGEGIYDMWVAELARVDAVLPKDNEVHSGLRLIDGRDVNRAVVDESGNGDGVVPPHDINAALAEVANDQVMADAEAAADDAAGPAAAAGAGAP